MDSTLHSFVALLRGINVGGHSKIAMSDLRRVVADLGFADVSTYIQSGNVLFRSDRANTDALAAEIEQGIATELGLSPAVMVRGHDELGAVLSANPFLERESDPKKLHVAFLAAEPEPDRVASLVKPAGEPAEFAVRGREMYLHYPEGSGRTKLGPTFFAKLGVAVTTRNWRTVTVLHEKSG